MDRKAQRKYRPRKRTVMADTADGRGQAEQARASATWIGRPPWTMEFIRRPASRMPNGIVLTMSVSMNPGAIALTVTPYLAIFRDRSLTKPMTPALAVP